MDEQKPPDKPETSPRFESKLNYYVVVGIFILVFFYQFGNSLEPQINSQLDFFELTFIMAWAAPALAGLIVSKRYWGSKIFGQAYLALGLGYACLAIGQALFSIYQIAYQVVNPYPYYPDIFFSSFYLLALYHLRKNTHYFKRKLSPYQKVILIIIPGIVTAVYIFAMLVPITITDSVPDLLSQQITVGGTTFQVVPSSGSNNEAQHLVIGNSTFDLIPIDVSSGTSYPQIYDKHVAFNLIPIGVSHLSFGQIQHHDQTFYNGLLMGIYYVAATSLVSTWALVGFQVFRGTVLGAAWGLLLVGLVLNSVGDITYVYSSIYYWDRGSVSTALWVAGGIIVTYALYKHRRVL